MKKLAVLIVIFVLLLSLIPTGSVAFADEQVYSDALYDLQQDENFDANAYSVDLGNNSIDIITLARGEYDELYVYTYQPAIQRAFYCSSINISRHNPEDREATVSYDNYRLLFCNNNGVFYKYIVEGFTVCDDSVRYYCISEIMRPFDSSIDELPGNGQTITEVPVKNEGNPVSKEFVFYDVNGKTQVECKDLTTIEITSKYVGYIHYSTGGIFHWGTYNAAVDSHFVAFSTNWNIEELYDADIKWSSSNWHYIITGELSLWNPDDDPDQRYGETIDDPVPQPLTPLYSDVSRSQESDRLFADEYDFKQIQTVSELLDEENDIQVVYDGLFVNIKENTSFSVEAKSALESQQWVLRFCETPYIAQWSGDNNFSVTSIDRTRISDVIILRLHFRSQGQEYNLGVVDNKQTGSKEASASSKTEIEFTDEVKDLFRILLIILAVIALVILLNFLMPILKAIWWVITLPFKLFRKLLGLGQEAHPQSTEQPQRKPSKYRYRR